MLRCNLSSYSLTPSLKSCLSLPQQQAAVGGDASGGWCWATCSCLASSGRSSKASCWPLLPACEQCRFEQLLLPTALVWESLLVTNNWTKCTVHLFVDNNKVFWRLESFLCLCCNSASLCWSPSIPHMSSYWSQHVFSPHYCSTVFCCCALLCIEIITGLFGMIGIFYSRAAADA